MQFRRFRWSSSRCLPCCRRRLMTWISKKVEELISYDNTIAALCLRVANSPLFGRRTVETVSEAIVALGMKRVQSILLSCALTQVVPASHWAMDAVTYWRHCLGCALVCRKMATLIRSPDTEKLTWLGYCTTWAFW
ncbi:MAG: hypothetical protein DMG79_16390 [Acidobacteria bacterium]|nr:MAG: hypothetical protein DMG79_16390 [Acidobacteriota bacterium]